MHLCAKNTIKLYIFIPYRGSMRCMHMKKIAMMLVIGMMLLTSLVCLGSENASAWSASVRTSPNSADTGEYITYTVTVENTGSQRMKVSAVQVRFGWDTSRWYRIDDSGTEVVINAGQSRSFSGGISVPSGGILTDYSHTVDIEVTAYDPGFWGEWAISPTTSTYTGSMRVTEPSSFGSGSSGSDSTPGFSFMMMISAVSFTLMIATWKKKRY